MCYTIAQLKLREYKSAIRDGLPKEVVDKLYEEWLKLNEAEHEDDLKPGFRVSGFEHPSLNAIVKTNNYHAIKLTWGLIPTWVKDKNQAFDIMNKTLNARGETIFEKPAFRESAKSKRCILLVDGFYEYHHFKGKTYPYFITHKEKNSPFVLAGLWSEWVDQDSAEIFQTATILTTSGNALMTKIHNNPKADGPRMPLILHPNQIQKWLEEENIPQVKNLIQPCDDELMSAHTVGKFTGVNSVPDSEHSMDEVVYPELNQQQELF